MVRGPVDAINRFYSHNFKWLTVVSVALTLLWFLNQFRKGKSEVQSLAHLEQEMEGPGSDDSASGDSAPSQNAT